MTLFVFIGSYYQYYFIIFDFILFDFILFKKFFYQQKLPQIFSSSEEVTWKIHSTSIRNNTTSHWTQPRSTTKDYYHDNTTNYSVLPFSQETVH